MNYKTADNIFYSVVGKHGGETVEEIISTIDQDTSLDEVEDANPAAALGGLTYGVTNLELTNAFAAIANEGNYREPLLYTKVYDHYGKVILDNINTKETFIYTLKLEDNLYKFVSRYKDTKKDGSPSD